MCKWRKFKTIVPFPLVKFHKMCGKNKYGGITQTGNAKRWNPQNVAVKKSFCGLNIELPAVAQGVLLGHWCFIQFSVWIPTSTEAQVIQTTVATDNKWIIPTTLCTIHWTGSNTFSNVCFILSQLKYKSQHNKMQKQNLIVSASLPQRWTLKLFPPHPFIPVFICCCCCALVIELFYFTFLCFLL